MSLTCTYSIIIALIYISFFCPIFICAHTMTDALCTSEEDIVWRIQWPDATPGSTQSVRCPGEGDVPGLGLAHRNCLTGGVWGAVDASNCEPVAIRYIGIQVGAVMCTVCMAHSTEFMWYCTSSLVSALRSISQYCSLMTYINILHGYSPGHVYRPVT